MTKQTNSESGFKFRYESKGFGWATVTLSAHGDECSIDASYIGHNPLRDMLDILAAMKDADDYKTMFFWYDEPGTLLLELEQKGKDIHLTARVSDDDLGRDDVDSDLWTNSFETHIQFDELVNVILMESERNLRKHGIVGFSMDWAACGGEDVFPMSSYLYLKGIDFSKSTDAPALSDLDAELDLLR